MDLSSLVFVAIIGVWAAYLVPHWLSRRDDLSQSRTPDRFSGGLRVLQRRSRKPRLDGAGHRSGDAVLTSPRVVIDADGEYLYIPADRALAARAEREAAEARARAAEAEVSDVPEAGVPEVVAAPAGSEPDPVAEPVVVAEPDVAVEPVAVEPDVVVEPVVVAEPVVAARPATVEDAADADQVLLPKDADLPPIAVSDPEPTRTSFARPSSPGTAAARPSSGYVPSIPEVDMPERPSDLEVAIAVARVAARRRAVIMALLFAATVLSWVIAARSSVPGWAAVPATVLLVLHILASRVAGLRSRETLMMLAVQVRSSSELLHARSQQRQALIAAQLANARPVDPGVADAPERTPDRVARRAASVGAQTWDPIPVPPPTYTLKPAAHRPEPAPLERPAAARTEAPAAVSRGALPRRAADVERILALESHLDELFEEPKVVNG